MARIYSVVKARKDQGTCNVCRKPIDAGTAYNWSRANRFVPKVKWHATCAQPRPSVLEGNPKRQAIMAAQETAHDALDALGDPEEVTADDIMQVLTDCAEAIREVAGEYEEAADNIESGFGGNPTSVSDELREKAETLNSAADEVEGVSIDERPEPDEPDPDADPDDLDTDGDDPLTDWLADQIDTARSAIDDIEVP